MINAMSSWAKSIILSVIIATIIQMILPEGNNKKYIKTIIGLYILFTIISPIINKINNSNKEIDISKYENYFTIQNNTSNSTNVLDNSLDNTYISSVKLDIKNRMKEKGYLANNIVLDVELKNKEKYGTINSLKIDLLKDTNLINNSSIKEVEKVIIKIEENKEENQNESNISSSEEYEIKKYLSETYNIKIENIEIL